MAERVPDGATIQFGIGGTSNVVGLHLKDKKDLGVHTEMLTDSMMELYEQGAVTGKKKTFHPGKIVCGFSVGTEKLYDFMDNNPICEFAPIYYTNSVDNIAQKRQHGLDQQYADGGPDGPVRLGVPRPFDVQRDRRPGGLHTRRGESQRAACRSSRFPRRR